jgi:competence protein ComEC
MSMAALTAYLWRREPDLLSALALSAIVYLAWDPIGIYNIGFQISFLTVASFALFGRLGDTFPKTASGVLKEQSIEALRSTLVAYMATLPLLAFYFGTVSLVAIPSNLAILPAVMVLVVGGLAAFALSFVVPSLSGFIANALLSPLSAYLEWALHLFGKLTISTVPGSYFSGFWLVPIYAVVAMWVRERVRPA